MADPSPASPSETELFEAIRNAIADASTLPGEQVGRFYFPELTAH
jgi:hypothetical protein